MNLKGKKVIVAGLGLSGRALCRVLSQIGADVCAYDSKPEEEIIDTLAELKQYNINICLEEIPDSIFEDVCMLVVSPGIPMDSQIIKKAIEEEIEVIGEVELAYEVSKAPIYAITGTNGKTTTTSLLGEIFKNYGKKTFVAGNIGYPLIDAVMEAQSIDVIVAEISSFQLETIKKFKPKISSIINITPDHLNRHKTLENYVNIKGRIFENQDMDCYTILNYDDGNVRKLFNKPKCRIFPFSRMSILNKGTFLKNGMIYIKSNGEEIPVIKTEDIYIPGGHNVENAMVAVSMAYLAGVDIDTISYTLKTFKGVEHRIEFVKQINGVKYFNDSKGTNPDAAIKAIEAMNGPIILIAGGYDKGVDFDEFVKAFKGRVVKVILLGTTAKKIFDTAIKYNFEKDNIIIVDSFEEAVHKAFEMSKPGDNVLLSPACASWDMFKSFEERGRFFKDMVKELRG
ncbi:MAG: UDP-N-acetylmuramoyl-L-alanine--D-glutamate ligase [Thermoanaerobacteraceae bacterium]|nr:UDP-N-acetylmuramoyl-L-alanine--D-glutamate ligase [Thermoanaerobacteraceae bacterium]